MSSDSDTRPENSAESRALRGHLTGANIYRPLALRLAEARAEREPVELEAMQFTCEACGKSLPTEFRCPETSLGMHRSVRVS